MTNEILTLRVTGLGHKLTLEVDSSLSLLELKEKIAFETTIPAEYQRLICHGKNLNEDARSLADSQLQDRTKIMLLHNKEYAADREAFEQIHALKKELENLASSENGKSPEVVHELVTQICCKLDAVDIHGSETLRKIRKDILKQAESIDS